MHNTVRNTAYYLIVSLLISFAVWNFFFVNRVKSLTTMQANTSQIQIENIKIGQIKDTIIYLENMGKEDLLLDTIGTDCGCTVAKWHKNAIKSGERTPITIRFEAREEGIVLRKIKIYANTEQPLTVHLKAIVKSML